MKLARPQDNRLAELCTSAGARARGLGHELDAWAVPPGEEIVARRTVCRRCGRTLYVRVEGELTGFAGGAASDRCDG